MQSKLSWNLSVKHHVVLNLGRKNPYSYNEDIFKPPHRYLSWMWKVSARGMKDAETNSTHGNQRKLAWHSLEENSGQQIHFLRQSRLHCNLNNTWSNKETSNWASSIPPTWIQILRIGTESQWGNKRIKEVWLTRTQPHPRSLSNVIWIGSKSLHYLLWPNDSKSI